MVGIIVTTHQGKLRPNGQELLNRFIESCDYIKVPYIIYVFDNSSETPIKVPVKCRLTYVKDQTIRGLTGTWNDGIQQSLQDKCSVILISNDDVEITEDINKFIEGIKEPNILYGPLSDGVPYGVQKSSKASSGYLELTGNTDNMCNGFFMGFTSTFATRFEISPGKLFNEKYPWGYNEEELQIRIWEQGGRSIINQSCFIKHTKIRGWTQFN
jgi:hypothetical protein